MEKKLPHPVGVCSDCGTFCYSSDLINHRCDEAENGERCKGIIHRALRKSDWKECYYCNGTGSFELKKCPYCSGSGWLLSSRFEDRMVSYPDGLESGDEFPERALSSQPFFARILDSLAQVKIRPILRGGK